MKIHEYQAKKLLADYGIPIPRGRVAKTPEEAKEIASEIGAKVVVKAQIHAGGRGRAGGIKMADTPEEAAEIASGLLGKHLVTHQTGPQGVLVSGVLVEEALEPEKELYLGIVVDSTTNTPVIMGSEAGGVEIEEIAAESPEKIIKTHIHPDYDFQPFQARSQAFGLNLKGDLFKMAMNIVPSLYRLFWEKDCSLAEINPLVVTPDGRLVALDAKINFDDNAVRRHPDIAELRDPSQEDPIEVEARNMGILNYVKMDGDIAIIVNGAGLAMSVMDTLEKAGGKPANFLDIGTVNRSDRVVNSFKILTSDPSVKSVLINIFGGMARVDVIAQGIIDTFNEMAIEIPVVVRLAGTNVEKGEQMLAEEQKRPGTRLKLIRAYTFGEAAEKAVAAAKGELG